MTIPLFMLVSFACCQLALNGQTLLPLVWIVLYRLRLRCSLWIALARDLLTRRN